MKIARRILAFPLLLLGTAITDIGYAFILVVDTIDAGRWISDPK